jgi:hypothetical protein
MAIITERRRYERVSFHCRVEISDVATGTRVKAWTTDISLGGVRIATPTMIPVGRVLDMTFLMVDPEIGEVAEQVQGQVANAHSNFDGHSIGVVFHKTLKRAQCPKLASRIERL